MGVGAPQHPPVEHARVRQVGRVHRLAADLGGAVDAALVKRPRGRRILPAPQFRGPVDRLDDGPIAGATADVAVQGDLDVLLRWVRILVQQGAGGEDHARGAEAALEAGFFPERLLHRVQCRRRLPRPSMVVSERPAISWVRVVQALTGRPSSSTVQEPQTSTSQLVLVPLRSRSLRRKSASSKLRGHAGAARLAVQLELNLDLVHGFLGADGSRVVAAGSFICSRSLCASRGAGRPCRNTVRARL